LPLIFLHRRARHSLGEFTFIPDSGFRSTLADLGRGEPMRLECSCRKGFSLSDNPNASVAMIKLCRPARFRRHAARPFRHCR